MSEALEVNANRGCEAAGQSASPTRSEAERGERARKTWSLRSWRQRSAAQRSVFCRQLRSLRGAWGACTKDMEPAKLVAEISGPA
ncbi:MAG TPA: hypothetical protein VEW46_23730 [Pyrinomonadaceae bacterium]|nr:hypothetical protein [Pyrinomonadaceae bacterium]